MIASRPPRRSFPRARLWPYVAIAALPVAVEAALWLLGLWTGSPGRLRVWATGLAGFWPGLLGDWQPNYPFQPVVMFATYWLIHAGPGHLAGNLAVLGWFAWRTGPELRPVETLEIWMASVLGGAVAFGVMSESISPMIGASGGVFGLLGCHVALDHGTTRTDVGARAAWRRTALICAAILALSAVDFVLRDAVLAWQAHLGGFLTGALLTWTIVPRAGSHPRTDPP